MHRDPESIIGIPEYAVRAIGWERTIPHLQLIEASLEGIRNSMAGTGLEARAFQWPDRPDEEPVVYIPLPDLLEGLLAIIRREHENLLIRYELAKRKLERGEQG